ncbi:MAG: hypothetical protein RR582_09430, partial [Niameybacter sp.]
MSTIKTAKDQFITQHLYKHFFILTLLSILFIFLFTYDLDAFLACTKLILFVMAAYLLINAISTRHITQNAFLSYMSIFYGAINVLQGLQIILDSLLKTPVNSYYLSMATHHLGKLSFSIILVIVSYYYVHKPKKLEHISWYLTLAFIVICTVGMPLFANERFATFVNGHSLSALFFNLTLNLLIPIALLLSFNILSPVHSKFSSTLKLIMLIFVCLVSINETISFFYFVPLSGPSIV